MDVIDGFLHHEATKDTKDTKNTSYKSFFRGRRTVRVFVMNRVVVVFVAS